MEKEETTILNQDKWEKCIATEDGEVACCEWCKTISGPGKKGDHLYCEKCKKFIWRKKAGK